MMQVVVESVEDFLENFECVGSFSQDKKEPNSIVVPGCPPLLDWRKMEAEEGEITLVSLLLLSPDDEQCALLQDSEQACQGNCEEEESDDFARPVKSAFIKDDPSLLEEGETQITLAAWEIP